jgi:predicted  nucleic acid-binding Zn-ribbon protein
MNEKINIAEQTDLLISLQAFDTQIYKLMSEKELKPLEINNLEDSLKQKQSGMKGAEDNLKSIQLKHKEKEIMLGTKEEEVRKLQAQLNQIKTNKEYTTMINEIESHKADNSLLEEEIIKFMDSIDEVKARLDQEKQKFAEESKNIDTRIKEFKQQIKDIEAAIIELKKKREGLTPLIGKRLLSEYERILAGKDGQALAEVVNDNCGGCYMQLPSQVINEINMKEKIIFCENCQRILYIKDEKA